MEFTGLEQVLVVAMIGGVGTVVGYVIGMRGKQSVVECDKCRVECSKSLQEKFDGLSAKYSELSLRQDKGDSSIDVKLDILFRMVRAIVMHLPIDAEEKAHIVNDRGGK